MEFSPALSVNSDMTDEQLDAYFATYVPLSNLPTPPPAKEQPSTPCSTSPVTVRASAAPELQVYATHLANLVPSNISPPPSSTICTFLARANLPDEIIAFAACILDTLSWRFDQTWRQELPHTTPSSIIVLAALALAHGYLADHQRPSRHWSLSSIFTVAAIEATKRAILADVDYGLFRISNESVQRMLRDLRPAARSGKRALEIEIKGLAVWRFGDLTPEPSP